MAVRFSASGESLSIGSPPSGGLTIMGWLYVLADQGDFATMFAVGTATASSLRHFDLSGGEVVHLYDGDGNNDTGTTLSLNTWYHVCLTDSDADDRQRGYLNGVLDVSLTQADARSTTTLFIGNNFGDEWQDGRMAYVKVWNAELTAGEILQEMNTIRPVRTADLWAWLPTLPGTPERARDYSGNGRNFTENGTLSDEDPPSVSWGAGPLLIGLAAAGINPSVSDGVSVAESFTVDVSDPQISVSESVSVAESVNLVFVHFVNVSDAVGIAESIAIDPLVVSAIAAENVSLAESIGTLMLIPGISISDNVSVADTVAMTLVLGGISVSDAIGVAESLTVRLLGFISVSEAVGVATPLFSIEIDNVTPAAVVVQNYARLLIGDITGRVIGELSVELGPISWRLNNFGRAQFTISRKDSKATRDFLGFGNRVLFQFDNGLPEWGGIIDPDRQWTSDGKIVCTAYGGEYLLGTRATEQTSLHEGVTIGAVFEDIILRMNAIEETGIVLGDVWKGGAVHSPEYHYDNILDVIKDDLLELEAADFELQASLSNGKIVFTANLRERLGSIKRNVALLEGRNLALVELGERGPIVNVAYATGSRADWDDIREIGFSIDATSVADFGRREVTVQHSETEQGPSLDNIAQVEVDANRNPREILMLDAVDLSPARFADCGLGDTIRVWLYSYGFSEYDHLMRIVGREYYPATNLCRIVAMRDDQ